MIVAARNLAAKALRRASAAHKPLVHLIRRTARASEQASLVADASAVEREIAAIAKSAGPIIAGPWLAEVGYEALYWVPFLRWVRDAYRIRSHRLTVVSRGGVEAWYGGIAGHYIDILDHLAPEELASGNEDRQLREEGGGRKQSAPGSLDQRILAIVRQQDRYRDASVLHPSLMFRLFRHVWHGNLPLEFFWERTDYALVDRPPRPLVDGLPADYIVAKFYTGAALPETPANREAVGAIVRQVAELGPVVALDTGLSLDDHRDYVFSDVPNVISARPWLTARHNLGLQTALVAHSRFFVGTCGGLAWLAPFLGVPTVAVYADDRQLAPHLLTARQAGRVPGAAQFSLLDLRSLSRIGFGQMPAASHISVPSRVEADRDA